jgi:pimeloyl-ACP methyl ester carboxylesterase
MLHCSIYIGITEANRPDPPGDLEMKMTATPDFTKLMQDMMASFPVDSTAMQNAFKTQAAMGEKLSKVALEAAEKSTEISATMAKSMIAKLGDVVKAKTEPTDYTKAMSDFASATAEMAADVVASGIAAKFDLVLTYDYENLGTPIGDTALALEQALKGVGIAAGDGKSLTILAHSTGGLVSRCFIERGGGRDTVDHLVMCGTPNGGSPLGKAGAAMAVARLLGDFAANVAPASLPFLAPLRSVLKAAGGVTKSLEQINPASNFILELNASDDPGVRYTILAGSIDAYVAAGDGFAGRALVAAGRSAAFDLLFENQPNDIAVGVESIKTIGGVRAVKPVRHDVACHHLNYFASDAGRAALQAVAW